MRIQSFGRHAEAVGLGSAHACRTVGVCTVVATAMLAVAPTAAQAACVSSGAQFNSVINCTADQAGGVDIGVPAGESATLNIQNGVEVSAFVGAAVRGGDGDEAVNNAGTVIGSVDLGDGVDRFNLSTDADFSQTGLVDGGDGNLDVFELSGAGVGVLNDPTKHTSFEDLHKTGGSTWTLVGAHTFRSQTVITGGTLDLATGATLQSRIINNYNGGTLSVGGKGKIGTAMVVGSYQQQGGAYAVDVDPQTGNVDLLVVTETADLKGVVNVNFLTTPTPGTRTYEIVRATGNTTIDDSPREGTLALGEVTGATSNTLKVDIGLERGADEKTLYLRVTALPASPIVSRLPIYATLNASQRAVVDVLAVQDLQSANPLDTLNAALIDSSTDIGQYQAALDVLLPEVHLNTETVTLFSALDFMSDLFSCPTVGDGAAVVREGQCVWVRPKGRKLDRNGTSDNTGYEETVGGVSAGVQFRFAPGWFANVGGSYERGSLSTDTGAESDSDRFHVGSAVKYEMGPWLFAGAVSGGIGSFDTSRRIAFTGFNDGTATSEHDVRYIAGQLRVAYQFAMPGWYVRPLVDLNVTYLDREGVTESGAGTTNLTIDGGQEAMLSATPAIEVGGTYNVLSGATLRPFLMAGVTMFANDEHTLTSAFTLAPDATFETVTEHGDVFANLHAGASLVSDATGFNLTIGYRGLYADDVAQHGVYAKGAWMLN
ncbi:MAG: autotransporter outer membrane beta-barrel domain-containing protein [Pseudomonadota bacterium]